MDPITGAIVAALAAGVASEATEVGKKVIVDAYKALKAAIKKKYGQDSKVVQAIADVEKEPDYKPGQDNLAGRVEQTKAAADPELQQLTQALMEALKSTPEGEKALGKYHVNVSGGQVGIIGDHAKVEGGMHFGAESTHFRGPGDTFNVSGDFRGAILNIKSILSNVSQSIGAMPNADPSTKDELKGLIDQLDEVLQKAPPEKAEEAEAVAESARMLVETAAKEKPNQAMVQISAEGLKMAAQNIAQAMPTVLTIATQIVAAIARLMG